MNPGDSAKLGHGVTSQFVQTCSMTCCDTGSERKKTLCTIGTMKIITSD